MMFTLLTLATGFAFLIIVVIVDLKVVKWIMDGGLKTWEHRFVVVYFPLFLCFLLSLVYFAAFSIDARASFVWTRRLMMILNSFYGIGFLLYIFAPGGSPVHSLLSIGLLSIAASGFFQIAGLRFNVTPSMPKGIYVLEPMTETPARGDLVTFCLESDNPYTALAAERDYLGSGYCPSGLKPLLKRLAGLSGDMVEASPDGIILDGSFLAGTARPEFDSEGRLMPPSLLEDGPIPAGMALVVSQQLINSFDSRHFGLVPFDSLTKVTPVLTGKETSSSDSQN
jgi:conjugative transfer signal peptidase TraF